MSLSKLENHPHQREVFPHKCNKKKAKHGDKSSLLPNPWTVYLSRKRNKKPKQRETKIDTWGSVSHLVQASLPSQQIFLHLKYSHLECARTHKHPRIQVICLQKLTIISLQSLTIFSRILHCSLKPRQTLHCTVTQKISAPSL